MDVIRKTVFHGPMLVVWLGIEGSGHHGICQCLAPRCSLTVPSISPCFAVDTGLAATVGSLLQIQTRELNQTLMKLRQQLRGHRRTTNSSVRVMLQCSPTARSSEGVKFSYPAQAKAKAALKAGRAHHLEGKSTFHIDATLLARLAEDVGLDVRFVLLQRPLAEASASIAQRFRIPFESEARIIRDNWALLQWQVSHLDTRFVFDFVYKQPDVRALASFLRLETAASEAMFHEFSMNWHSSSRSAAVAERQYEQFLLGSTYS
jgi:hypothetical protein